MVGLFLHYVPIGSFHCLGIQTYCIYYSRFEGLRNSDDGVEIGRLLERTLKESRCMDLESLCIVAEEKVVQAFGIEAFLLFVLSTRLKS